MAYKHRMDALLLKMLMLCVLLHTWHKDITFVSEIK